MIRPRRRCPGAWVLAAVGATSMLLLPTAAAKELAPFRAALDLRWSGDAGSDAFRADLTRYVGDVLATRCFEHVSDAADTNTPDADVALTILLTDVVDETRYDDTIAEALQPGESSKELRRVARFEVRAEATLSVRASGKAVQKKRWVVNVSRRPVFPGEDPQTTARAEVIERMGNDLARWLACGRAKLENNIRAASKADAVNPPDPR